MRGLPLLHWMLKRCWQKADQAAPRRSSSQHEASRAKAEAKYALRQREQEAKRVSQEEARVRELEIAMRQAEQSNIILGSEVGRLDDDKVRLERSIRERNGNAIATLERLACEQEHSRGEVLSHVAEAVE